ncbi:MAG: tetratricopeptide repeat protein [Gemmatimonadaceae bacterium]
MPTPQRIEEEGWTFFDWLQANNRALTIGGVVVVIAILGGWFYMRSGELRRVNAERMLNQAKQSVAAGNAPLAQADLQRVATRYKNTPSGAQAAMILAQMQYDAGQFAEGLQTLNPFRTGSGDLQASVLSLIGDGRVASGQAAEAAETYKEAAAATTMVGEKTVYRSKAARALMAAGKPNEARELWQQLADDPDAELVHAEAQIRLGELGVQTAGG